MEIGWRVFFENWVKSIFVHPYAPVNKTIYECILLEDPRLTEYQGAECTLYVVQSKCNSVSTDRLRTANGTMKIKRGIRLWEAMV